jgi:hypothetical protein
MNARNGRTAAKGLRGWWLSPPRSGMQRLIAPPEYRHLRAFAVTRLGGGIVAAAAGILCLSYAGYGWAAFFLVIAALNLAAGYWELTIARSPSSRGGADV